MKKILFVAVFCFAVQASFGQVIISLLFGDQLNSGKVEFGLDGGLSLSNIGGIADAKNRPGFNLGFYFDIKTPSPAWLLSTGVVVKGPMGARGLPVYSLNDPALDSVFHGGSVTTKLGYFYVPITMKYLLKNGFYLKGGIQLGLINSASDEFMNSVKEEDDVTYKLQRKKDFAALDAGLAAGIGYRIKKGNGMNLGISYYYGLVDVESDDVGPNQYNRVAYFNVGIPIGKGKAAKKAAAK